MTLTPAGSALAAPWARSERLPRFFQGLSLALLAVVLLGFARTFYARPLFAVPQISWFLYLHGSVLTAWFALLFIQSTLVASHRTDLHRRLGVMGAFLAIAVLAVSLIAVSGYPRHVKAGLLAIDTVFDIQTATTILWTDFAALTLFTGLVSTALILRRRREVHRRLMALASIAIIGPAAARTAELPGRMLHMAGPNVLGFAVQMLIFVVLPLTLIVLDLRTRGRLHPATVLGLLAQFGLVLGAVAIAGSPAGAAVFNALT
ncbi:MAG TPA: hypothetical protein VGM84_21415 [Steroidobacteraceae bacterium]|jgi:hypothetical protein